MVKEAFDEFHVKFDTDIVDFFELDHFLKQLVQGIGFIMDSDHSLNYFIEFGERLGHSLS